jgi:hypothetical protein
METMNDALAPRSLLDQNGCEVCGNPLTQPATLAHEDDDGTVTSRTFTVCHDHEKELEEWVLSMQYPRGERS